MSQGPDTSEQLSPLKRAILELREMRAKLDEADRRQREPIAIVGIGMRLPGGANDESSFWQILADGVDAISEIPPGRWDREAYYDPDPDKPGKMNTRHGAFLEGVDLFDAEFFGISPREAASMDPQHRLLLETTWEALENSAICPERLAGSQTGVFVGYGNSDYLRRVYGDEELIDAYSALGNAFSVAAGRLSYFLGVHGPCMVVDTACSASLVAVHLACQSLRSGECTLALAAGVNLILSPEASINFAKSRMLAPDGRCKTFDAGADGYGRGEGCGVVILKTLSAAQIDNNRVLAVIRGSAVNQDGRSGGLTAPNGPAQEAVIRAALTAAGVEPHEVSYLEAHGTGTSLGDPIEVRAASTVLCKDRLREHPLAIGSIKTNIGHLEGAAGVAGLLKVVLALQKKQIPAHLHLKIRSPYIDWDSLPIVVPTSLTPWIPVNGKRIAGLSSFGFSGTNVHVIVEQPPEVDRPRTTAERPTHLLALSGKSDNALAELVQKVSLHLESADPDTLPDICFTANAGRSHFEHRVTVLGENIEQVQNGLDAFIRHEAVANVVAGQVMDLSSPPIAFLFTGQGSQYIGMGRELYETSPTFRRVMDRCDEILLPHLKRPLLSVLYPLADNVSLLNNTAYTQAALFAVEYALAELWRSWGVRPAFVMGHSVGEYVAACIAGVFGLEDGLKLIAERGRLMQSLPAGGRMAAVFAGRERVESAIAKSDAVSVAAINGPELIVISGDGNQVEAILKRLSKEEIKSKDLLVSHAFHSPLMNPVLDEFEKIASDVEYSDPTVGFVSNLTGELADLRSIGCANYWRRHAREPVQFAAAVKTLKEEGVKIFLELGPDPVLLGMARRSIEGQGQLWLPSLRSGRANWPQMLESLQALYVAGADIDWAGVDRDYPRRRLALPTYPFQRRRYWLDQWDSRPKAIRHDLENSWRNAATAALRQSRQTPIGVNVESYVGKWSCLERLTTAHAVDTLRVLGAFARTNEVHDVESLVQEFGIPAVYKRLLQRWLERLAAAGMLRAMGGKFMSRGPLPDPDLTSRIRETEQALADDPDLLAYIHNCGERLSQIMAGKESPLETLFPGGSSTLAERLYAGANINRYANAIAGAAVEAAEHASKADRPFRVLEVGAGTGGTSATILPLLDPGRCEYVFSDVSDLFLTRARQNFAIFPFASFVMFDLEKDLETQGFALHSFDVVVAANVVHAARDLDGALKRMSRLLVPGGILLLVEATRHHEWFDFTTGLIEGWQHFDDALRGDHPLLTPERWKEALLERGFCEVIAVPEDGSPAKVLGQHVILARVPGAENHLYSNGGSIATLPADDRVPNAGWPESTAVSPERVRQFRKSLELALSDERAELMNEYVRTRVMEVLRMDADRRPAIHHRLMDLGLDSLMAVQLRNLLESGLGLGQSLPATLMFDYPTIAAISGFLQNCTSGDDTEGTPSPTDADWQPQPMSQRIQEIEALSDDEAEALLLKRLERK
jgi:acyl transferase domain-containing protein/SAM-dependent methyltransferase/acyl carrier protein